MSARAVAPGGLVEALRIFAGTFREIAGVRGALLAVEWQEEVERIKRRLLLTASAALFLHTAFLLCTLFIVVAFWDSYRLTALGVLACIHLALGALTIRRLRLEAAAFPAPFAATREEFARDLSTFRAGP